MSYPILIICYRRTELLQQVIDSVQALKPSKIYFHIHDANEVEAQKEVDSVLQLIKSYEGEKEVLHIAESLGVYDSIKSGLKWISKENDTFFVFEDDVILNENSAEIVLEHMHKLHEKGEGILKFGLFKHWPVYWGWGCTRIASEVFTTFSFDDVTFEKTEHLKSIQSETHLKGLKHMYAKMQKMAWDDEYGFIQEYTNMSVIETEDAHTTHLGVESTRVGNGIDIPFKNWLVIFENGEIVSE